MPTISMPKKDCATMPSTKPNRPPSPAMPARRRSGLRKSSAANAPERGADDDARQAEGKADQHADGRPGHAPARGPGLAGPEQRRHVVGERPDHREHQQDPERPPADAREVVGPGDGRHAREDDADGRRDRHRQHGDAEPDQHETQHQERRRHAHMMPRGAAVRLLGADRGERDRRRRHAGRERGCPPAPWRRRRRPRPGTSARRPGSPRRAAPAPIGSPRRRRRGRPSPRSPASTAVRPSTSPSTEPGVAPKAMRTPISCVRAATTNDSRPWMPRQASSTAIAGEGRQRPQLHRARRGLRLHDVG